MISIENNNFAALAQLRFTSTKQDGLSSKLKSFILEQKTDIAEKSNDFKKYILRNKTLNNSNGISSYDWQTGKGSIAKKLPSLYTSGINHLVKCKDGTILNAILHQRQSADTLIIVAHGLGDSAALYTPLLWIFDKASIVFLDFRGHGKNLARSKTEKSVLENILDLPFSGKETELGEKEEEDVFAVTNYFKKLNKHSKYKKVVGMGFCFGAAMIVKAQAKHKNLFTHLILDSLWPDFKVLAEKFLKDPDLLIHPRKNPGGLLSTLGSYKISRLIFKIIAQTFLFKKSLNINLNICNLLKKIQIPVFLIYGKRDALISQKEFELLWRSINHKQKIAMINNNRHLLTFLKDKELYKITTSFFLNNYKTKQK
jgi:pimeloyl-ACP methyl ester carboxylesterase